jgi:hypothetical protein
VGSRACELTAPGTSLPSCSSMMVVTCPSALSRFRSRGIDALPPEELGRRIDPGIQLLHAEPRQRTLEVVSLLLQPQQLQALQDARDAQAVGRWSGCLCRRALRPLRATARIATRTAEAAARVQAAPKHAVGPLPHGIHPTNQTPTRRPRPAPGGPCSSTRVRKTTPS